MDTLSKSLYTVVSQAVDEFAQLVSDKYELSKEDVLELWNTKVSSDLKVTEVHTAKAPKEEKKAAPRSRAKAAAPADDVACCSYEFKKGKNIGTKCTAKVCPDSTKFCRKHKAQEGKEETSGGSKPEKKATKATAASKAKKADSKEKETSSVKKLNDGKPSYVLRKNKQGNYEHPETHFVFDKVSKEVYGRQTDEGVTPLTTDDIEECRKLNFKCRLPVTLSKKNDDEADEGEEEDIEEDEEVEDEEEESEEEEEDDK